MRSVPTGEVFGKERGSWYRLAEARRALGVGRCLRQRHVCGAGPLGDRSLPRRFSGDIGAMGLVDEGGRRFSMGRAKADLPEKLRPDDQSAVVRETLVGEPVPDERENSGTSISSHTVGSASCGCIEAFFWFTKPTRPDGDSPFQLNRSAKLSPMGWTAGFPGRATAFPLSRSQLRR